MVDPHRTSGYDAPSVREGRPEKRAEAPGSGHEFARRPPILPRVIASRYVVEPNAPSSSLDSVTTLDGESGARVVVRFGGTEEQGGSDFLAIARVLRGKPGAWPVH